MSTTSTRPVPRPLHLVSNSIAVSNVSGPSTAGPRSAPLISDSALRPAPRRQSSISYKPGIVPPRRSSVGLGVKNDARIPSARDAERTSESRSPIVRDPGPATLAEKHADLLRFIAQKESRCLELRTQLVQHEADLLLLKRKWERIVSKGGPRVSQGDRNDVFDGIREGVQSGLGKVFAVLEPASTTLPQSRIIPKPLSHAATCNSSTAPGTITTVTSDKRASTSRSSFSGSRSASSAGSLFDDISGLENQSSASSVSDSPILKADADGVSSVSPRHSRAFKRNSFTFAQSTVQAEPAPPPDDDPSAKRRRVRPASVQVPQPPAVASSSPTLSPGTPLGRQVSAWVPELNRKWEELKSNETFTKQSKRASVLLNDVLAALVPPVPPASLRHTPSQTVLDSTLSDPAMAAGVSTESRATSDFVVRSLLDDDEDEGAGVGEVLQPEVKIAQVGQPAKNDEDDIWNW